MTLVPPVVPQPERVDAPWEWRRGAEAVHDGATVAHLVGQATDVPRVATAVAALASTGAFAQVVLDATPHGAGPALAELGVTAPLAPLTTPAAGWPEVLVATIDRDCVALVLHSDDETALAGALAASRRRLALVRASRGGVFDGAARAVARLCDLVLVDAQEDARAIAGLAAPERVHVIGNLLVDVVRQHARDALAREAWRAYGVESGTYALAVLQGPPRPELNAPLAVLADAVPLLLDASPAWTDSLEGPVRAGARLLPAPGFVDALSLIRGAGATITDCTRTAEIAATLGVQVHALPGSGMRSGPTTLELSSDPWSVTAVRPRPSEPTPAAVPMWDGRAGERLAEVLVANFARVRLA